MSYGNIERIMGIMDNSSVQPNISLDHPRMLPLYTSASDASPKVRKSPL
jgi:hypothetical protein